MENEIYEYIDELSDAEKISLLLIGETSKIKSTRLQKLALIVHSLKKGKIEIEHGAYLFGGFSDDVEEGVESLRSEGYLEYKNNEGYSLTKDGKKIFEALEKKDSEIYSITQQVVKMFNNLSDRQVTAITYKLFPELTTNSIIKEEMNRVGDNIKIEQFNLKNLKK